jgi:hypothetical protein
MPKNIAKLLMTEPQADFLADTIEEGIEAAHQMTLDNEEGTEEYKYGVDRMVALVTLLSQFDEENPILDAEAKPGREFDWEAFWDDVEAEESEEGDEHSVAGSTADSIAP